MTKFFQFCQLAGLHPFVGFGMFAVDLMLFGSETASLGISWPISVAVAIALTITSVLYQKHATSDKWGLAIAKGLMVGILTAIPTPLPSIFTLGGGVLGTVALLTDGRRSSVD